MRLSLLKASNYPDPTADKGMHSFTYSLYVHTEEWYDSGLIENAWQVNNDLHAACGCLKENIKYFQMLSEGCIIDAIKKTEDGNDIVLRLHETYGGRQEARIRLNFGHSGWYEADLMENSLGEVQKGDICLSLSAFEIKTIVIKMKHS